MLEEGAVSCSLAAAFPESAEVTGVEIVVTECVRSSCFFVLLSVEGVTFNEYVVLGDVWLTLKGDVP